MAGELERYYHNDRLPDRPRDEGPSAVIKSLWVDRAPRWINTQRAGIDTWPADGKPIKVKELVDAYIQITSILDQGGNNVGVAAEFRMKPHGTRQYEHMATFYYGPPRSRLGVLLKRRLFRTQYHI